MAEVRLIDANALIDAIPVVKDMDEEITVGGAVSDFICMISEQPTIDAVVLPKGKVGDCVKWNTGVSVKLFQIHSILICEDGIRYDLGDISPFVDHSRIMGILSQEEAEKILREKGREYDNY